MFESFETAKPTGDGEEELLDIPRFLRRQDPDLDFLILAQSMIDESFHIPVLTEEVIGFFSIKKTARFWMRHQVLAATLLLF